jgi:hypothetical protein
MEKLSPKRHNIFLFLNHFSSSTIISILLRFHRKFDEIFFLAKTTLKLLKLILLKQAYFVKVGLFCLSKLILLKQAYFVKVSLFCLSKFILLKQAYFV